jgi:hypothetical protein
MVGDRSGPSPGTYRNLADAAQGGLVLTAKSAWADYRIETRSQNIHWIAVPAIVPATSITRARPPYYHEPWVIRTEPPTEPSIATVQVGDRVDWSVWTQWGPMRIVTNGPHRFAFSFRGRGYALSEGLRTLLSDDLVLARFKIGLVVTISASDYAAELEPLVGILATTMLLARLQTPGDNVAPGLGF